MPVDFDLYLLPRDGYTDFECTPALAFQSSFGLRAERKGNVCKKTDSDPFLDRKWTADDNVESSARFSLDQHYNAETTLRNNISSSNLCILESDPPPADTEKPTKVKKKRTVSFADSQGLPLESVCYIEDISKYLDGSRHFGMVYGSEFQYTDSNNNNVPKRLNLSPCFEQPISNYAHFLQQLEENSVSLENIMVEEKTVRGTVKVKNLGFEKKVRVRCSYDDWNTHTDIQSTHVSTCAYSNTDTFTFEFGIPSCITRVEFALQYLVTDREFWDNNGGQNYKLQR